MPYISASIDAFLVATAAVLIPSFYLIRRGRSSFVQPIRPDASYRTLLTLLLVAHSVYIIYFTLIFRPPNIFQRLQIPLTAPPDIVRSVLLGHSGLPANATLPKPLETLLTRISSFDMRTLYVRFGQAVVQDCEHCKTFDEYALFALPRALLEYIRETVILGLLTITGSDRERWRTYTVGALLGAAIIEGYWILTAPIHIPKNGQGVFMWHDNLWLIRQLLFLSLPVLTHNLAPTPATPPPIAGLAAARGVLEQTVNRLASLHYTHGAVMRDPALRAAAEEWWKRQRVEGEWARNDESVRHIAERLGRGFGEAHEGVQEGRLRVAARGAVVGLKAGLVPVVQ
ncbi:hypothetical protein SCP_1501340 [Sparassis crispa]|uniref:Uncharacterized protein n=1 Tax=Sparassis crispa TaxID=139825 RepID=A0A401H418_9APHY|nr:hypothetical protein SCP_1501340 [Sparassis crispa]GBE89129.1 hypothetical protein SCP_1501340 [Sparassis crispa]